MSAPRGTGWKPGRGTAAHLFGVSAVAAGAADAITSRYWHANGWWGDQGSSTMCVIYAWLHALHDGPLTRPGVKPIINPVVAYQEAQRIDGTPISDVYSGLTCDAGAQVMRRRGFIGSYRWANDLDEILDALVGIGQVTLGMAWPTGMDQPATTGLVRYNGTFGDMGHQVVLNGFNKKTRLLRGKNSWGRGWGNRGLFYLPFSDVPAILRDGGVACVARELPTPTA